MFKTQLKSAFFIGLLSFPFLSWSSEMKSIREVITNYFEGYQQANTILIQKAFHSDTKLLSVDEGKMDVTEMKDWIKGLEDRHARGDVRKGQLIVHAIDIKDYAASVKLEIRFEKFIFTDYLSLLKLNGQWMIVGKIYHFQNR